ncbi:MAG: 30S ribosomal protein S9 [Propionibacteriaceae bacterium]|nr:30S ribosomal protein S9 [Propionibacteriaceae bacterium]
MTEVVDETYLEDEDYAPFTDEDDREIAYRAETESVATNPGTRPAIIVAARATGRRKEAIAQVRIVPGDGQWSINGRTIEDYFPNKLHQQTINEPLVTANVVGSYDIKATITGGGVTGQAGALRLGLARALNAADAEASRAALKKSGQLTRDARIKERKKAGLKKARKAPQYSKR